MTNVENQMTKEGRSTNDETIVSSGIRALVIPSSFDFRHSSFLQWPLLER